MDRMRLEQREIQQARHFTFLLDEVPIGEAQLHGGGFHRDGWVWGVEIYEPHRGLGLGRQLMLAVLAEAQAIGWASMSLWVREDNAVALSLYESLGFERIDACRRGVRMRKRL